MTKRKRIVFDSNEKQNDSRQLYKIGVNFSNETRNIEKWLVEEI